MTIHRISNIRNTIRIEIRDHDNQERAACAIAVAYYIEMNITTKYHLALLYLYSRYIHFQLVLFSFLSRTYEGLRERDFLFVKNLRGVERERERGMQVINDISLDGALSLLFDVQYQYA